MQATERRIRTVAIDRIDGGQARLGPDDRVFDRYGRPLGLDQIPNALTNTEDWIDFETEAQWQSDEEEPWQIDDEDPWRVARARLYARAVAQVLVIYDEEAE